MHVDEIDAFMIKKQLSDKMRNFSTTLQSSYCRLRISSVNGFRAEFQIWIAGTHKEYFTGQLTSTGESKPYLPPPKHLFAESEEDPRQVCGYFAAPFLSRGESRTRRSAQVWFSGRTRWARSSWPFSLECRRPLSQKT
ncbi:uncharacterized protein LOC128183877 [Crassostrea angulata]|uniref:uncharacterized protein LOC128183877 n=1 Tax=Magallana angulata TaxID=2784310 RepID=UPI0022B12859|nr:uncharacterized protein LOC128183877 [Crassostrea angulata]